MSAILGGRRKRPFIDHTRCFLFVPLIWGEELAQPNANEEINRLFNLLIAKRLLSFYLFLGGRNRALNIFTKCVITIFISSETLAVLMLRIVN